MDKADFSLLAPIVALWDSMILKAKEIVLESSLSRERLLTSKLAEGALHNCGGVLVGDTSILRSGEATVSCCTIFDRLVSCCHGCKIEMHAQIKDCKLML